MFKRIAIMALLVAFISLAIPSDTFACRRHRGAGSRAAYARTYYGSPYRYRSVASDRYYAPRGHSTRNMILRIAAPAAIGAGVGALFGGKRGAGVGALLGGGGGAIYHLTRNRSRRY